MGVSGGWVGWLTKTGRSFSESAEESYQGKDGTCMVCLVGSRGLGLSRLALWCSPVNVGAKSSCAHFLFLGIDFLRYLPLPSNLSALFLFPFSWTGSACVHSWGGGACAPWVRTWLAGGVASSCCLSGGLVSWFGESHKLHTVFFRSWDTLVCIFGRLLVGCRSAPTRLDQSPCFTQTLFQVMFQALGEMKNEI